ncbi:hypothetical protein CDQ91_06920 [Sphingopyxis witflariensis]|uniref:DUF6161 domain-containing protein n=1 Tax=Sphingopyxis witflariensis TaxID=173675 RepID=A0A246JYJ7_9SPHN|nr:hypothetical protein CDQ91_06920 [Sphingopyxis witflariensis]
MLGIQAFAEQFSAADGQTGEVPNDVLKAQYEGNPPSLIHSTSESGQAILAIRTALGVEVAAVAYGMLIGHIGPVWTSPLHVRALFLVSNPSMIGKDAIRQASRVEYTRWQNQADALLDKHGDLVDLEEETIAGLTKRADQTAVQAFWRIARRHVKLRRSLRTEADTSITGINNVKKAFAEDMKLKASVQYWAEKKGTHSTNRGTAVRHLAIFSGIAGVVALLVFWFSITFMLEASGVNVWDWMVIKPEKGRAIAVSTYLIITGAVGTVLTVIFWTARVLLRNYLTERRLEGDAEERRIMTQTYLALISEGAADNEDRLIILNALFRPSPDQPTGDDGGGEVALPALIAKLLDQRASR